MTGRPSSFTQEIADAICERIADGQSLREICRDESMPDKKTVLRWLAEREEFRAQYASAREAQADHFADEILEISDDGTNDWTKRKIGEELVDVVDHEHISRSKLRVDARKWLMARMAPKKYGDRVMNEHTGRDGGAIETKDISDTESARRIAFLLAKGAQGSDT